MTQQVLFDAGDAGYHTFRIPALVTANNGDLLAFAEARKDGSRDNGDIDLVLRRSSDGGETWSDIEIVGDRDGDTYGNPTPIVAADGTIHLLTTSNTGDADKTRIRNGESERRRMHYQRSTDHGRMWTPPREITDQVTPEGADWRWYATGPGHGIQLTRGEHEGRLIAACDHSDHEIADAEDQQEATNAAHVIYSDDGGETWHMGGMVPSQGVAFRPWESTAVELVDGRVYLNARNQAPPAMLRVEAFSDDGGETFGPPTLAEELLDPHSSSRGVQASVLRYAARDRGDEGNRLLFSHPDSHDARANMTVRSSLDEAASWNAGRVIHPGPSGYSDLARLPDGRIGLLYEHGDEGQTYSGRISFARFSLAWLDGDNSTR